MAIAVGFRLGQRLPFFAQQLNLDVTLNGTVFEALREDIQPVVETVQRHAHIAQRKQRGCVAVVVASRLVHHREIDAWLLERFDIAQRQQQFFARVTRRVEIETAGVHQIRHLKDLFRLPVG